MGLCAPGVLRRDAGCHSGQMERSPGASPRAARTAYGGLWVGEVAYGTRGYT
jgi:hypothetical protein